MYKIHKGGGEEQAHFLLKIFPPPHLRSFSTFYTRTDINSFFLFFKLFIISNSSFNKKKFRSVIYSNEKGVIYRFFAFPYILYAQQTFHFFNLTISYRFRMKHSLSPTSNRLNCLLRYLRENLNHVIYVNNIKKKIFPLYFPIF